MEYHIAITVVKFAGQPPPLDIVSLLCVEHSGNTIPASQIYKACSVIGTPTPHGQGTTIWNGFSTVCTHAKGLLYTVIWQPANRFWLFQGIESAVFFGLAAALLALAFWWVGLRIS